MPIRAIVSDLDDTMLNGEGKLSSYTLEVMHKCTERGIRVIAASGRTRPSILPFVQQLDTRQPYIAGNGSEIVSADHKLMYGAAIPVETAKQVLAFIEAHHVYVHAYREDCFYYSETCGASDAYTRSSGLHGIAVGNLTEYINFESPKLFCVTTPEHASQLLPEMRERFKGLVDITTSKPQYIEVIPPGVSKGNALRRLAEMIDLRPEETVVFGDGLNDASMFEFTKNSVAMGNARKEVLQTANYVCGLNTDDGMAHFVEENILHATGKEVFR